MAASPSGTITVSPRYTTMRDSTVLIDLLIIIFTGGRDSQQRRLANYEKHKVLSWIVTPIVILLSAIFGAVNDSDAEPASSEPTAVEQVVESEEPAAEPTEAAEEAVAEEPEPTTEEPSEEPAPEPTEEAPAAAPAIDPEAPQTQAGFITAIVQARSDAEDAETDLQRSNVLNVRSEAICGAVPEGRADGWIGTVRTVDANGEGKAVVAVELDPDIEIGTWNNAFSDVSDNTLIEQGTPLFDTALELAPGDKVKFSGEFKKGTDGNDECFYTSNMTEVMDIDSPDYIFTFESLEKVG